VNGVLAESASSPAPVWPAEGLYISDRSSGSREFKGLIDEVRLSDVARDSDWIGTEYAMMNESDDFMSLGLEEFVETPVVSGESPVDGSIGVSLSLSSLGFDLLDYQGDSVNWSVETSPNIGSGSSSVSGSGSVSVPVSGLIGDTVYVWFVNVSDGSHDLNESFGSGVWSDR